jgi:phosphoglucosamine mutase
MSNFGLEQGLADLGVDFMRANVGDRYVLQALKKHGGVIGGEASGHILHLDRVSTGDGIVAALAVIEALSASGQPLHEAHAPLKRLPQTTINLRVRDGAELIRSPRVQEVLRETRDTLAGRGRVVLRASGTEPLVRVTIEAADADEVQRLAKRLADSVQVAAETA